MGYSRLIQPDIELSDGEAQRIKLATELYPWDVDRLLDRQLNHLVEAWHTVIVAEHEMQVVAQSDWVIDIGPGIEGVRSQTLLTDQYFYFFSPPSYTPLSPDYGTVTSLLS